MLLIIAEKLDMKHGHEQTQIHAIKGLYKKSAISVLTAHDSTINLQENPDTNCILASKREQWVQPKRSMTRDLDAIQKFIGQQKKTKNISILVPTASVYNIKLCINLLELHPELARFSIRVLWISVIEKLSISERHQLVKFVNKKAITLLTETISLCKLLQESYGLTALNSFLLPASIHPDEPLNNQRFSKVSSIKIGYLGSFRKEKGAFKLPTILADLKKLLNNSYTDLTLEFVMQKPIFKSKIGELIYSIWLNYSLRNTAKANQKIKLSTLDKVLSHEAFVDAIHSVDLLIVPYELKAYRARGSSIIIDGVLAGKPVVYTDGIGHSELLEFGNAEAAIEVADFAPKIMSIVQNMDSYYANAVKAQRILFAQIRKSADFLEEFCRNSNE